MEDENHAYEEPASSRPHRPGRVSSAAWIERNVGREDSRRFPEALNNIVNQRAGISPEMAIPLAKAFGSSAQTWLRMQSNYDLAQALKSESKIRVRRFRGAEVAA